MARARSTKRTARNARVTARPIGKLRALRSYTMGAVNGLLSRGVALGDQGRKLALATTRQAGEALAARAGRARARTLGAVSRLEAVFEQRVSKAVSRLGVPSAKDVRALSRQVARLQASVNSLR
jgi:poly(hydroxyalkanoate) granule-associated protein